MSTITRQTGAADPATPAARGPWRQAFARLRRNRSAMVGLGLVIFFVLVALTAPLLVLLNGWDPAQRDPTAVDAALAGIPRGSWGGIGAEHWFGVEPVSGRDLFSRVVMGTQVSMFIAFAGATVVLTLGVLFGIAAGYFGGWVDVLISRFMDLLMSFPGLIFMIAIMSVTPDVNRVVMLISVIGFFGWPGIARIVRGETLSVRHREFVDAARTSGARPGRILLREILPNVSGPIIAFGALLIPGLISAEAALSFLGVGIRPPTPSWGQILSDAVLYYDIVPTYFAIPSLCLFLVILGFSLLGDGLRDAIDPKGART
ncbi:MULTISPECIES: ABC transporter permease [unclassified Nonomuraea]|uniref:ABC transporter permease n=1 Tax=Nonomuraea sp. NPDC003804 TaxID=3154547 RepID=UPI0033AD3199